MTTTTIIIIQRLTRYVSVTRMTNRRRCDNSNNKNDDDNDENDYNNDNNDVRAAVSVLIGSCCPALVNRIHANVYTVVLLGK